MDKLMCVYDDVEKPKWDIQNIVGNKAFGDIIFKKKSLSCRYKEPLEALDLVRPIFHLSDSVHIADLIRQLEGIPENTKIIHAYSNYVVRDLQEFSVLLQKAGYIQNNILVTSEADPALLYFVDCPTYIKFLKQSVANGSTRLLSEGLSFLQLPTEALLNISEVSSFLQYITGGFDARYFNSLKGDEFTVVKTSTNKEKIKCEYQFYQLLPENMRSWFVMPFDYKEEEDVASYSMERYHMTDMAIRWVHGAVDLLEYENFLKRIFYFISTRHKRQVGKAAYWQLANDLFVGKLEKRIIALKQHAAYGVLKEYVAAGTGFSSVDDIVEEYRRLYEFVNRKYSFEYCSVVGHGDLCFSNILFSKEASLLRLIDPKGALHEEELWTNPYYDVAKLSHSICGSYDYFNNGLYEITLNDQLRMQLEIDSGSKEAYVALFKEYLERHGFAYDLVRLYEASLFLSMLPLHMDNPHKVFGFLLNGIAILEEVNECLQK